MQILRAVLVLVALFSVGAQFFQERRRLEQVGRLSGPAGRDLYEAARRRGERAMAVVTVVFGLLGIAALLDLSGVFR